MPILEKKEKDFGTPYKTFAWLSDGDAIWVVNLRDLSVMGYPVVSVVISDQSSSMSHNLMFVEYAFFMGERGKCLCEVYDGNTFIDDLSMFDDGLVIATDRRIADSMASALHKRCSIQWEMFNGIFGSAPGAMMPRDIRLG